MQPTFKSLKLWERPDSYCGATYENYYCGVGVHRDSDIISQSNFDCFLAALRISPYHEADYYVEVAEASHWACGWVKQVLIHKDAAIELLIEADEMLSALEDFPILDGSDVCERECEAEYEDFKSEVNKELCKLWESDPTNYELGADLKVWKLPVMVGDKDSLWTNSLGGQYRSERDATFWMVDDINNTLPMGLEIETDCPASLKESYEAYRHAMDVTNNYWSEDSYVDAKVIYVAWAQYLRKQVPEYQIPRTQYSFSEFISLENTI